MATYGGTLRRGLPRTPGGEPWPPVADMPASSGRSASSGPSEAPRSGSGTASGAAVSSTPVEAGSREAPVATSGSESASLPTALVGAAIGGAAGAHALRRGLPRTPGGEPWPPEGATGGAPSASGASVVEPDLRARADPGDAEPETASVPEIQIPAAPATSSVAAAATAVSGEGQALRRGLPRTPGGEPWPPAGAVARIVTTAPVAEPVGASGAPEPVPSTGSGAFVPVASEVAQPAASASLDKPAGPREPLPFTPGVTPGKYAFVRPAVRTEPPRIGPFTRLQWAAATAVLGVGLLYAAAMAVLAVRWFLSTEVGGDFIAAFPGEYHLPEGAPVGVPAWLAWQHFFNFFLMFLIIRSGWRVRREQRPSAYWTGRGKGSHKISLNAWFHQSLDILWILNGMVFLVLLFATGQWMKVVPTSWEVFPNALSAILQYASLDWPTENGWVNYNSIQQLTYFTTIFIAAPLAVITGFRMSGLWPSKAAFLNKVYPIEWARAVHFPVMLYFVLFIFVHVVLVFATGALRNLNHMFAAQGSIDPDAFAGNWTGFWIFSAAVAVLVAAWVAARPMVLAPIARLFGTVSSR